MLYKVSIVDARVHPALFHISTSMLMVWTTIEYIFGYVLKNESDPSKPNLSKITPEMRLLFVIKA